MLGIERGSAPGFVTRAALSASLIALAAGVASATPRPAAMADGYITGTVRSEEGPEAGVWVIAETMELRTGFIKIVVTDDDGRFVLPELPEATYNVWVRGYGLVDSAAVEGRPGDRDVELTAVVAPTEADAAKGYPADYWYSLYAPPAESEFPGTGPSGNGVAETMLSQKMWLDNQKSQCNFCHQVGNALTRSLDHMKHLNLGSSQATWDYRTQLGVRGSSMAGAYNIFGREAAGRTFADWTDRIAAGELPPRPARPDGVERNVVVTLWDWGVDTSFMHDE